MDGFVFEGKIHRVDPQGYVVGIGKTNANAIAAHNPARARHYGSEKVPEVEIGNHVIGQFKEKSNTLALFSNCCCEACAASKSSALSMPERSLSHHR